MNKQAILYLKKQYPELSDLAHEALANIAWYEQSLALRQRVDACQTATDRALLDPEFERLSGVLESRIGRVEWSSERRRQEVLKVATSMVYALRCGHTDKAAKRAARLLTILEAESAHDEIRR